MAFDSYSPCPCGSGKKFKFCCHAVAGEMEKVHKLLENNQSGMALQAVDSILKSHPDNPWAGMTRTQVLLQDGDRDAARENIDQLAKSHGDHPSVLVMHAATHLSVDGFELSRRTVHRAFQKCPKTHAEALSQMALRIAMQMYDNDCYLSAREHLALAVRYAEPVQRQAMFLRLASFETDDNIAYPLRSVHQLLPYSGSEEQTRQAKRAARLSSLGCWEPAAILYGRLTEEDSNSGVLWRNLGLCRAWDGNDAGAAEALHRAAELLGTNDRENAVECETLAQLLDMELTDEVTELVAWEFNVESVSRLLSSLDECSQLARLPLPNLSEDVDEDERPVALYQLIDRTVSDSETGEGWTVDDVPNILGDVAVFDGEPAIVSLTALDDDSMADHLKLLADASNGLLSAEEDAEPDLVGVVPNEVRPLQWSWWFPNKVPATTRRRLENTRFEKIRTKVWPETQLAGLNGNTPHQVKGDPAQQILLDAAVYVFDSICNRGSRVLDTDAIRDSLQLPKPSVLELDEDTPVAGISAMQLHRIDVTRLNDRQIIDIVNRAMLIKHQGFVYRILSEVVSRPGCMEEMDTHRVYSALFRICREQNRREEALDWIRQAREAVPQKQTPFQHRLEWDVQELSFRTEDPTDSELPGLVRRIMEEYGAKIPELPQLIGEVLTQAGLENLLPEIATVTASPATESGGVWTPGDEPEDHSGKKLWVPD